MSGTKLATSTDAPELGREVQIRWEAEQPPKQNDLVGLVFSGQGRLHMIPRYFFSYDTFYGIIGHVPTASGTSNIYVARNFSLELFRSIT